MTDAEKVSFQRRLRTLERRIRAQQRCLVLAGLTLSALGAITLAYTGNARDKSIARAHEFILVDSAGNQRARLASSQFGVELVLNDSEGSPRIAVGVVGGDAEFPSMRVWDRAGVLRTVLGSTLLTVGDPDVKEYRPESSLVLFSKEGKIEWKVPSQTDEFLPRSRD